MATSDPTPTSHSFRTRNPDIATRYVTDAFTEHRLDIGGGGEIAFQLDAVPCGSTTIARMAYGAPVALQGARVKDHYHANLLVSGGSEVAQGSDGHRFAASSAVAGTMFGPEPDCFVRWTSDASHYHVQVPRERLERQAATLVGSATTSLIDFDLSFDLHSPSGRSLLTTVRFLYAQLSTPGGPAMPPAVLREYESALLTHLLTSVGSDLNAALSAEDSSRSRSTMREVLDHIDRYAHDDLGVAELAKRAGVTVRSLQSAFRRETDMTPTEYIRRVRLERARRELLDGKGPVTDVAVRWHFFHAGRFAEIYRLRYGETPSQTLKHAVR